MILPLGNVLDGIIQFNLFPIEYLTNINLLLLVSHLPTVPSGKLNFKFLPMAHFNMKRSSTLNNRSNIGRGS
jgi:hypothetical protein